MRELHGYTNIAKDWLTVGFDLGRDGAHVHVGLALFIVGLWLTRGRWPLLLWLALLMLELGNEVIDMNWRAPATTAFASIKDVGTTMLLPSLLWWVLAVKRRSSRRRSSQRPSSQRRSGEDAEQPFEQR